MSLILTFPLRRAITTAGLVASISAAAAGCGGGSSTAAKAATTTTSTTVAGRGAGLQAFRQCMSTHGVTIPQRAGGGGGGGGGAGAGAGTSTSQPPDNGGGPGVNGGGAGARFLQPPAGVDPAKYQTALAACRSLIPTGGGGGAGGGAGGAQFRTAYIAYVTCLRNHGVQTGDPSLAQQALAGVDRTSATFMAAAQACRPLLPQRNPGTTTTSTVGA